MTFIETVQERVLVGDGAMGTLLLSKGIRPQQSFEALCLTEPAVIRAVHEEYITAGADLIETNTFGANRFRLIAAGYERQVKKINRAAATLAREAAGDNIFVAGSVGAIPFSLREDGAGYSHTEDELFDAYSEQIAALSEGGVDVILLETFEEWENLAVALRAAREVTNLPIIAQMAHSNRGLCIFGRTAEKYCRQALSAGAFIFGSNCGGGFSSVREVLKGAARVEGALLSAFPNAGIPQMVQGRILYPAGPEYFSRKCLELLSLGVRLVGGCCGTTPRHIKALRRALDRIADEPILLRPSPHPRVSARPPEDISGEGGFLSSLRRDRLPIIVEIDPPASPDLERVIQGALEVKNAGGDAISMADNPLASLKVSSICAAAVVRRRAGIQVIPHLTTRDHNVLGLQSILLGAQVVGIEAILAVTGDPVGKGDQPGNRGIFNINSIHLVGLIDQLNRGHMLSGRAIARPTDLSIGVAFNANAPNLKAEVLKLRKKVDSGARFALTQPVFTPALVREVMAACSGIDIKIFIGIYPLISDRNAEFMENEVPGITIPLAIRERLAASQVRTDQSRIGLEIASELIDKIKEEVDGLYLISPLHRWTIPLELVKRIRE
ncbi:MAG: bifunctional homocysteine S-methyltransferase/methylenetetrahydrofolate reductase [Candidatus Euphemobacter frigidus]|nr:bifunctional homocysteine S-methyltransferase/methylenetetrahydrofolate reductase [Candidatus Euphemobacter frigidus]MDP8275879.1 bifunctional homocysteine S-methyltransferase/methylenetetrahydrofolate reductase [Candidatus Euphemobacter frigidus]